MSLAIDRTSQLVIPAKAGIYIKPYFLMMGPRGSTSLTIMSILSLSKDLRGGDGVEVGLKKYNFQSVGFQISFTVGTSLDLIRGKIQDGP